MPLVGIPACDKRFLDLVASVVPVDGGSAVMADADGVVIRQLERAPAQSASDD